MELNGQIILRELETLSRSTPTCTMQMTHCVDSRFRRKTEMTFKQGNQWKKGEKINCQKMEYRVMRKRRQLKDGSYIPVDRNQSGAEI